MASKLVTDQTAFWRLLDQYPRWLIVLEALRERPGSTTTTLATAGAVRDATNTNGSLEAMERRGLVTHTRENRGRCWFVSPHVVGWLAARRVSGGAVEIAAESRIAMVPREQISSLARALLDDGVDQDIEWVATMADRSVGAIVRLKGRTTTTDAAELRERLGSVGVSIDDVRIEDVAEGRPALVDWARRVLGANALPPGG